MMSDVEAVDPCVQNWYPLPEHGTECACHKECSLAEEGVVTIRYKSMAARIGAVNILLDPVRNTLPNDVNHEGSLQCEVGGTTEA